MCFLHLLPFHNVIFFHNYCPIHSTTMFTAYTQHIHTVLFTITLPSTLTLLFTYAVLFTMWYFFTITAQFTLQQCLQHILNIYIQYWLQLHYPVHWLWCLYILSFSQCDIFSQLRHNWHYTNVCSISSTYTYNTIWNTLASIMTLLFAYASFSQYDIFSQLLPNWLYNNVYSIY